MSNLFNVYGRHDIHQGTVYAHSYLMAPAHGPIPIVGHVNAIGEALEVALRFVIDGDNALSPFLHRVLTTQELADLWERCHHEHHGYDARGLDPRVEPTRLTIPRHAMLREAAYR